MALTGDRQGRVWVATEFSGVWRFAPSPSGGGHWTRFTHADTGGGLGDDDVYSLTCDRLGRVWAGTGRDGVSVFNGKAWKSYARLTGPLGCHVVALATSPLTDDVWGATEAGLFRYSLHGATWRYVTRTDGLPSDQATCLAFSRDGTLFVGTACDGLAIASPKNDYHTWRHVPGPDALPNAPGGDDLPSPFINCLLVSKSGAVYAGTTAGLAHSSDNGLTWRFLRGADWRDKLAGLRSPRAVGHPETDGHLLAEDDVRALAEDGVSRLYIGHRQKGLGVYGEAAAEDATAPTVHGGYVQALMPMRRGPLLIGTYGDGLQVADGPIPPGAAGASEAEAAFPPLPTPAAPPTALQMAAMLRRVQSQAGPLPGGVSYLGEDWQTQGDWVGRYGRQYARLGAMQAPWGDHVPFSSLPYAAVPDLGPHHDAHDALRSHLSWLTIKTPRSLYDPQIGGRRQAEWDDHGETYPLTHEGPDLWVRVHIKTGGLHRLGLYFVNKDGGPGGGGDNRLRDYVVEVRPYSKDAAETADVVPPLARARVRDFWGGVYENFLLSGPADYAVRVARNGSLNTILSGVFLDRLTGTLGPLEDMGGPFLGAVRYDPPVTPTGTRPVSPALGAAQALWEGLDAGWDKAGAAAWEAPYRLLAYRAARRGGASAALLASWRWRLALWEPADKAAFGATMAAAYKSYQALYPPAHVASK